MSAQTAARYGLAAALNNTGRYKYKPPESVIDYLVVGGGVVGLAVARRLTQRFPSKTVFLVERHDSVGQEISSRNSEVIHAGLYYPIDSLKTQLCVRGRQMLYNHCLKHNIPHRKSGKLIVARRDQRPYIENLHAKAQKIGYPSGLVPPGGPEAAVPTELISGHVALELEPDLNTCIDSALLSPETGIIDTHAYMESLEKDIDESEGGDLAYKTSVVRVDPAPSDAGERGWVVQTVTDDAEESDAMLARTLINSSGLSAHLILNSLLPKESRIPMFYARGSYASYRGPGVSRISHLVYPCPDTGKSNFSFQSLGTHLTFDMWGKIRFGPDLDWLTPPGEDEADPDFWNKHLVPDDSKIEVMHQAVRDYLPNVSLEGFQPDYSGIRPKLTGPQGGFQDFVFRTDHPEAFGGAARRGEKARRPMISLMGIESPGLTSSLAIAELVVDDMLCRREGHTPE
ncbi:NAD dehydrogenase [Obba rivulosa]|uniref:L-2-hydroxyglutarate dehydrogenase, mitochondrial n=1 Tax=Obba rivulosa TaxID=1052685 RepID=A0A8E2ANE6_9APHY|nr:NAD dehydrogenase [Obba rivulosa]